MCIAWVIAVMVLWKDGSVTMGVVVGYSVSSLFSTSLNSFQSDSQKLHFAIGTIFGVSSSRMLSMGMWSVQPQRLGSV